MVTLVKDWAAPTGCDATEANNTNEKPKSFAFIAFPNDWTIVERSEVR